MRPLPVAAIAAAARDLPVTATAALTSRLGSGQPATPMGRRGLLKRRPPVAAA
jgi:hypothetical protein